ncbi:MAG: T9SS type A sorting domain-containing protein [Flavobacteriales bacterium]|nr:T9SS type A sorting domain-containing protein [Flavobacteriales bacterium]
MKNQFFFKVISCVLLTFYSGEAISQNHNKWCLIDFERIDVACEIYTDTLSNPNCIWQIGPAKKPNLKYVSSGKYCIITDTINPYPTNDTSYFILRMKEFPVPTSEGFAFINLSVNYMTDSDSLKDYGTLELTTDNGSTWENLLNYSGSLNVDITGQPIELSGFTKKFKQIDITILFETESTLKQFTDSVFFRFGFISDGQNSNRDGLMYDDFRFDASFINGLDERQDLNELIKIFPNPTNHLLTVTWNKENQKDAFEIRIMSLQGKVVLNQIVSGNSGKQLIAVDNLPSGLYLFQALQDGRAFHVEKLVVE